MEKANQHGIYTSNPPWRDSFNIKYHKTGDVKWSPCDAPMRGFHWSCSRNKLTCTQVKVEFNTDLLKLDFLVFVQADRAQPRSVWTADIHWKTVLVQTDSAQLKSACTADIYWEIFSACAATICRENVLSSSSTNELDSCPFRCVCKTCYFVIVRLNSEIVHQLQDSDRKM